MSFLTLNGITIPVRSCQAKHGMIGAASRALRGDYLSDVRAIKRSWRMQTSPMTQLNATALIGMLNGRGYLWPFDSDSYSDSGAAALLEQGTTYIGAVAADGSPNYLYNGTSAALQSVRGGCVSTDVGTTNSLPASQRDCEDTPVSDFNSSGAVTLQNETVHYWQGSQSLQATHTTGSNAVYTNNVGASSGQAWVGSVWVKGDSGGENIQVRVVMDGAASIVPVSLVLPSADVWYRLWAKSIGGAGTTYAHVEVSDLGNTTTWYMDGWQLELLTHPTAWVDGVRASSGILRYSSSLLSEMSNRSFSVAFWINGSARADAGTAFGFVFDAYDSGALPASVTQNRVGAYISTSTSVFVFFVYGADSSSGGVTGPAHGTYGVMKHYVCVYDADAQETRLYVNGALYGSAAHASPPDFTSWSNAYWDIGCSGGTSPLSGQLDDFQILPYAVDAAEAAGLYGGGTAPAIGLPRLIAAGDFLPRSAGVAVRGANVNHQNLYADNENNYTTVDFTLEEV